MNVHNLTYVAASINLPGLLDFGLQSRSAKSDVLHDDAMVGAGGSQIKGLIVLSGAMTNIDWI